MGKGTLRKWLRTFVVAPQATFMFSTPSRAVPVLTALVLGGGALIGAAGAAADTAFTTTTPFSFTGTNYCVMPAEEFAGNGQMHFVMSENLSTSGVVQSHLGVGFSGLQALTLSNKKYVVIDQENKNSGFDFFGPGPAHETVDTILQFVRLGEDGTSIVGGDDFYEHVLAHITANANGIVTVDDMTTETRCQ